MFDVFENLLSSVAKKTYSPSSFILECTGEAYDGIDDEFVVLLSAIDDNYSVTIAHISQQGKTFENKELTAGQPLFHVSSLLNLSQNMGEKLKNDDKNTELLRKLISYIMKWMEIQVVRLTNEIERPDDIDEKNRNEFYLSRRIFDKSKDALVTQAVIDKLIELMSRLNIQWSQFDLAIEYGRVLKSLEKVLRIAFFNQPVLIEKKNLPIFKNQLNIMSFEVPFNTMMSLVCLEECVKAEAYVNKAKSVLHKVHSDHRIQLECVIAAAQAYIASQSHDINLLLTSIKSVTDIVSKNKKCLILIQNISFFKVACEKAGSHFEVLTEYDKAIKYYFEAYHYSSDLVEQSKYHIQLKQLSLPFLLQISNELKGQRFSDILEKVNCYQQHFRIDMYFISEAYSTLFKSLLKENDISCSSIQNIPNSVSIKVDYEFDFDVFKIALSKVQKKLIRDQSAIKAKAKKKPLELPTKNTEKSDPHQNSNFEIESASGRQPKVKAVKAKKRPKGTQNLTQNLPRWRFLDQIRPKPLEKVEFPITKKIFDPAHRNGIVSLRVHDISGRWYACMNPGIIEEVEKIKKGEGDKIMTRFNREIELANDYCVPCFKEMRIKEAELGMKFPYVFKIRLLGCDGLANVRIYAKVIEIKSDGKKLVAYTAINPNSHVKHSKPIEFEMPDITDEPLNKLI